MIKFRAPRNKRVLILTHHNADIDALSSAYVLGNFLKSFGNEVSIGTSESVARQCKKIVELACIDVEIDPDCNNYNYIAVVDTSSYEQLKTVKNLKKVNLLIDHHHGNEIEARVKIVDVDAKSTSTIVYEILKRRKYSFNEVERKLLAAGIVSDTAHLRFANSRVLRALAEILKDEIELRDVLALITVEEDISDRIACLKAARRMEMYRFGDLIVVFSRLGSHEAIASRALVKFGADIAIVMAKKENELRISSRAREKVVKRGVNLAEIFREVGKYIDGYGGGHDLAGSCNGKVKSYKEVRNFILSLLVKKLGKFKRVKV